MFLDIGVGILAALFVGHQFEATITPIFLCVSIIFALLPDIDMVTYPLEHDVNHKGYKHRDLAHYPLIFVPLGTALVHMAWGEIYATLFAIATLCHFIHDSIGIGRGVKWLFPFSKNAYSFIYLYSRTVRRGLWQPIFQFRTPADYDQFDREHGDENWFKNIYQSWHPYAIIEFVVFILAIIILLFNIY